MDTDVQVCDGYVLFLRLLPPDLQEFFARLNRCVYLSDDWLYPDADSLMFFRTGTVLDLRGSGFDRSGFDRPRLALQVPACEPEPERRHRPRSDDFLEELYQDYHAHLYESRLVQLSPRAKGSPEEALVRCLELMELEKSDGEVGFGLVREHGQSSQEQGQGQEHELELELTDMARKLLDQAFHSPALVGGRWLLIKVA
ncbi:MAG: hypothetical protein ACYCOU_02665 [Sulfobacillus sp.]